MCRNKSESAIDIMTTTALPVNSKADELQYFYIDNAFTIFLREKYKTFPYFTGRVEDIIKF